MANRRMISKSISTSKQVNKMSDFAQLLFTWAIAHADDFGCMDGDPEVVLATVIPMKRDRAPEEISDAIKEWVSAELVWWYAVGDDMFLEFRTWDKHQSGLNKRTKSKYISHADAQHLENFREILRNSPLTELNRTELELKRTEQNDTSMQPSASGEVAAAIEKTNVSSSSSSVDSELAQLGKIYETEGFGQISGMIAEHLKILLDTFGFEWVSEAMREAVLQNKRRLKYVKGVLENWRSEGGIRRSDPVVANGRNRAGPSDKEARYEDFYALFPDT